jgi:hypothetical protein
VNDVRALEQLWPLRQRRHAVIACVDDVAPLEALRDELSELRAELIVEREPGALSAALGRPSVTVASKFGRIGWRGDTPCASPCSKPSNPSSSRAPSAARKRGATQAGDNSPRTRHDLVTHG